MNTRYSEFILYSELVPSDNVVIMYTNINTLPFPYYYFIKNHDFFSKCNDMAIRNKWSLKAISMPQELTALVQCIRDNIVTINRAWNRSAIVLN